MLQVKWTPRCPDSNEGEISMQSLNACSSFISQDERISESPIKTLQKAVGPHLISERGLISLCTLRGTWSSLLQMLTMPDNSWIFLGIPISHCQLESDPRCHSSLQEASVLSLQALFRFLCYPSSLDRSTDVAEETRVLKGHPRHNSRIYTRFTATTREKRWDIPLSERWGTIPLHCVLSNSMFPIKHIRNLDLLDVNPENTQEQPHKSRMTLKSPKECETVRCNRNQFETTPDSTVFDLGQSPVPQHTRQLDCLILGNYRDSMIYPSQI